MADATHNYATVIDRSVTGKRILLTVFFAIVLHVVTLVLACIVLFELAYSLITERRPTARVTRFAYRVLHYAYAIGEYVTCNKDEPPFPFDEFPNGTESVGLGPAATH